MCDKSSMCACAHFAKILVSLSFQLCVKTGHAHIRLRMRSLIWKCTVCERLIRVFSRCWLTPIITNISVFVSHRFLNIYFCFCFGTFYHILYSFHMKKKMLNMTGSTSVFRAIFTSWPPVCFPARMINSFQKRATLKGNVFFFLKSWPQIKRKQNWKWRPCFAWNRDYPA